MTSAQGHTLVVEEHSNSRQQLDELIARAIDRTQVKKEVDISRFICVDGYRLHHNTYLRMKNNCPEELMELIDEHIIQVNEVRTAPEKPKVRRSQALASKDHVIFAREEVEQLIEALKNSGNGDLSTKLRVALNPLKSIKNQLKEMIRNSEVDEELWRAYKMACRNGK